jgi:serine/threonine-protein kinase
MPPGPWLLDGRYLLDEPLAEGALGVVFRALHRDIGRWFAVKLLKPAALGKPLYLARFRREATALGRLRHPAIVEITDFGIAPADGTHPEGQPYLVMELVEGPTLADLCRRGPLPALRALPLLDSIAAAVDAARAQGILHRDLKPANVLLPDVGDSPAPVKVVELADDVDGAQADRLPSSTRSTSAFWAPKPRAAASKEARSAASSSPSFQRTARSWFMAPRSWA